jgi:hypothetical protein
MEISIDDTSVLATYEMYIYASLRLFPEVEVYSNKVTFIVECGNEVVTSSSNMMILPVYWRNDGPKSIEFSVNLAAMFSSSISNCPITKFVAYSDQAKQNIWSDS